MDQHDKTLRSLRKFGLTTEAVKSVIQHKFVDYDIVREIVSHGDIELIKLLCFPETVKPCLSCRFPTDFGSQDPEQMREDCMAVATELGLMDIIDYLLEIKVPITCMWLVCEVGNVDVLDRFVRHMNETNDFSPLKQPSLAHHACYFNHPEIVKRLFMYGCDFNITFYGDTPMDLAIRKKHYKIVELLKSFGIKE